MPRVSNVRSRVSRGKIINPTGVVKEDKMKIKKGLEISSSDFWYDLTDGGYLNPHEICENKEDADKVVEAIKIVQEFQSSCVESIEEFEK